MSASAHLKRCAASVGHTCSPLIADDNDDVRQRFAPDSKSSKAYFTQSLMVWAIVQLLTIAKVKLSVTCTSKHSIYISF
ncbi:MAG: hypothetical protein HC936_03860 [Leptolyngbyaceae cyanobacterium SU_3_3]|nr:hypothetical protein [Leptolyngbyaceae cyanobacterium SU_3_3]